MDKGVVKGTIRIGRDLKVYEYSNGWKVSKVKFPNAMNVIKLFKKNGRFDDLVSKDRRFLKGELADGKVRGARINVLPDGSKLNKAFSLFSEGLVIHDESSHGHWDVMFKNPNGKYAYVYTVDKVLNFRGKKYKKVEEFGKKYEILSRNVLRALSDSNDHFAVPMYTLLKTYMRVGNESYYNQYGHKGLTTLKKGDISVKGDRVSFSYLAKDGVPMKISESFPRSYIKRLSSELKGLKRDDFVFTLDGKPMKDTEFMKAFERYCGERFYPHIVRSYYATSTVREFLKGRRSASKSEVNELFDSIAEKLGHKKFDKKNKEWKDSHNVTIHYYLEPSVLERVESIIS